MNRDIKLVLVTPSFRFFDPLHMLLGVTLEELLEDVLDGPVQRGVGGKDRYPMRLAEGAGAEIALANFGELGFFNDKGVLRLTFPAFAVEDVAKRLGSAVISRAKRGGSTDLHVRTRAGQRTGFEIPMVGDIAIEVTA